MFVTLTNQNLSRVWHVDESRRRLYNTLLLAALVYFSILSEVNINSSLPFETAQHNSRVPENGTYVWLRIRTMVPCKRRKMRWEEVEAIEYTHTSIPNRPLVNIVKRSFQEAVQNNDMSCLSGRTQQQHSSSTIAACYTPISSRFFLVSMAFVSRGSNQLPCASEPFPRQIESTSRRKCPYRH